MNCNNPQRYRNYATMTEQERVHLTETTTHSIWRQTYHVQPIYGLLNDPNGFCYFNGQYQLFYQWFPFGASHGLKHWYHTTSTDLVNFINQGLALQPQYEHESHGIFSGSAIVANEHLYLFYTGNHRDENWQRKSSQCLAIMDKHGRVSALPQPLIAKQPTGYTSNFRDPKVIKINHCFYLLIGAQRSNLTGCVLVYQANDLRQWQFKGELTVEMAETDFTDFGFMWECPDLFTLYAEKGNAQDVLILSPQGLVANGHQFNNIYHAVALIGQLDIDRLTFKVEQLQELDAGFDFYAPQTTAGPDNRRLLIGWMGLPDIMYPSDKDNWANCLTLVRELTLQHNRLLQQPVSAVTQKRKTEQYFVGAITGLQNLINFNCRYGEIYLTLTNDTATCAGLNFGCGDQQQTTLMVDWRRQQLILDRSQTGAKVATDYGEQRTLAYSQNTIVLRIFLDVSSVEIFVNDGEAVFSSRLFPDLQSDGLQLFAQAGSCQAEMWLWQY